MGSDLLPRPLATQYCEDNICNSTCTRSNAYEFHMDNLQISIKIFGWVFVLKANVISTPVQS